MKLFIKKHWLIIFLAFCLTVILHFPQIHFILFSKIYKGLMLEANWDYTHYLTRVNRVSQGDFSLGNSYDKDYREAPFVIPPYFEIVIGSLGALLHISPVYILLISTFLGLFLLILLLYSFFLVLAGDKSYALLTAIAVPGITEIIYHLLYNQLHVKLPLMLLIKSLLLELDTIPLYSRPISPTLHFFIFILYLLCIYLLLQNGGMKIRKILLLICAILSLAISLYTFIYSSTLLIAFNFCLCILCLIKKDKRPIKLILIITFLASLFSVPYFVHFYKLISNPLFSEYAFRSGMHVTHLPSFQGIAICIFLGTVLLVIYRSNYNSTSFLFLFAIVLAFFLCLNQQVLTGREFQIHHYLVYFFYPFSVIFLIFFISHLTKRLFPKQTSFKNFIIHLVIYLILLRIVIRVVVFYSMILKGDFHPSFYHEKECRQPAYYNTYYAPVINYLKHQKGSQKTILANLCLSEFIAAYTQHYPAISIYTTTYLIPQTRLISKYFLYVYLNIGKSSSEDIKQYFIKHAKDASIVLYLFPLKEKIPRLNLDILYKAFLSQGFYRELRHFGVDYIIQDTLLDHWPEIDTYPFLKKLIDINGVVIYKVISEKDK